MSHLGQHSPNAGVPHQSPPPADGPSQQQAPRVRRRNRLINSCLECRRRKLKCDKGSPCSNCTKNARSCVFIASGLDADAQARLAEVKEKMGMLERSLEQDVAQRRHSKPEDSSDTKSPNTLPGQESYSDQEDDDETRNLDPSNYATEDANYYDDDGDEDIVDLGIAMGKVRITERIGGLVRPRFNEELAQALKELPKSEHGNPNPVSAQNPQDWLAPSLDYVAPSSSFFFAQGIEKTSLRTYLPARPLVDRLIAHYWDAVHVIARTVHRPTFLRQYDKFWLNVNANIEPRNSFQAVLFAAMLSSAISMSESRVLAEFHVHKESLVDNFRQGTEAALARANFLRTTRLETIQAFVMYLIPLCRNEISRAHSALTGMLIRLAECMGLHRDPTGYSSSPVEIHVRRLIWYQICFLDLRTCEATGPRPQIRPDDYDTRFPLNIDDVDLDRAENGERGIDVTKDRTYFTDMTITRMRFEGYEMHRLLWNERPKLERRRNDSERKVTLTSLLARVQAFKAAMEKTYVPMLNKTVPLHFLATEIHGIISNRLYTLLLQKYMSSDRIKMPPRLRQVVISASVMIIEHAMNIEQQPALATWSWYSGALQQYHSALLLLSELYASSNEPALEKRVWHCLDFSFGLPAERSSQDKTRFILEDLVEKTEIYASMKKLRVPTNVPLIGPRTYTPGYHARQREERERSESVQSAGSSSAGTSAVNPGVGVSPVSQQTSPPPPSTQAMYNHPPTLIAFPGAVPTVDWGTTDTSASLPASMPVPAPVFQQPPVSAASFNFNDFTPSAPVGGLMPPATMGQRPGSDAGSSPAMGAYGNVPGWTPGSSPMDALSELDWNDIEQMFGGSDVASGMLIPPYSFPQFAPGDVQWTT